MTTTATPTESVAFEAGSTYEMRWISDHTLRTPYTVVRRTPRFVTFRDQDGAEVRVGTYIFEGVEKARPCGSYSMAPVLSADRLVG